MSNINDNDKWKNLSDLLYDFNNNDEEIVKIINIISELDSHNIFSENYICKNHYQLSNIVDIIYNIFGDGICSNRAEYELYRSYTQNTQSINDIQDIENNICFEKCNKFRKYLELLNFVKNKYNQDINLICTNLPKWFISYLGLKI